MIFFQMEALLTAAPHVCASKKFSKIQNRIKTCFSRTLLKTVLDWIRNLYDTAQSSSKTNILAVLSLLPFTDEIFDFPLFFKIYTASILLAKHRPIRHIVVRFFFFGFSFGHDCS